MLVKAFITHKLSEKYKDCQDRFSLNVDKFTVAVSDGMSESIFPHYWAEILSDAYAEEQFVPDNGVEPLCTLWHEKVSNFIEEGKKNKTLHWRTEVNFLEGKSAGATLCGVKFENSSKWRGHVLGDSCLITINENTIEEIYSSEDKPFDSYPDFYDSNPKNLGRGTIREVSGKISQGKRLLLVSDPFSEYLSLNRDRSESLISEILSLNNHEEFCQLVDRWRKNGMHNDDSTLVIIDWDGRKSFNVKHSDDIYSLIKQEDEATTVSHSEVNNKKTFESEVKKDVTQKSESIPEPSEKKTVSCSEQATNINNNNQENSNSTSSLESTHNESSAKTEPIQTVINFDEDSSCEPIKSSEKEESKNPNLEESSNIKTSEEVVSAKDNNTSIHRDYVIALIDGAKKDLEKYFSQYKKRNKVTKKFMKQITPQVIYCNCINILEDLIAKIDKQEK